jgi:DNA-binding transcriptional ArsR family regulator
MPARESEAAAVFAALGDGTRLRLIGRLAAGEAISITALSSGTEMTRQAVTKHLHVLAGAGLLRSRRHGRAQLWQLHPGGLSEARRYLDAIGRQWETKLGRLNAKLEAPLPRGRGSVV